MNNENVLRLKDWIKFERGFEHTYPNSFDKDSYFYLNGMFIENSNVYDLIKYKFISFNINCDTTNDYIITIKSALYRNGKSEAFKEYRMEISTLKTGNYVLELPVECFDNEISTKYNLKFTRSIRIEGKKSFEVVDGCIKKNKIISVESKSYGKATDKNEEAIYKLKVSNCTDKQQVVGVFLKSYGNEAINKVVFPKQVCLDPQEEKMIDVKVEVSERVVEGGFEKQILQFYVDGYSSCEEVILYTSRKLRHPFLLVTNDEIEEIKTKINNFVWAKKNYERCVEVEKAWVVPEIDGKTRYLFKTDDGHHARKCAILYKLGGGEEFREKAVKFLKELSDPQRGYLVNPRGCNQELVHEGEFFKSVAFTYDLVYYSEELTEYDHKNIEAVLRKFMNYINIMLQKGKVSNWELAEMAGALHCANVLQDMHMINRFIYGVGGMTDILSRSVYSDGWWYEVSIGYNLLAVGIFSEVAHIMLHFGIDLRYITVPASYSENVDSEIILQDGLVAKNWGGNDKNYRNITMLWDSLVDFYNYKGVIFGLNDSSEMRVQGIQHQFMDSRYDLAYKLYGKLEYAELVSLSSDADRDLLFGVGALPNVENCERGRKSVYADSSGVCVLRSQKQGVEDKNQIQAVLKYGSHGGAHGHYDRVSMVGLMRNGRSLIGPENVWYSYHTMMYKFYVQTSISHNMVTVDFKLQDPVKPKRLLFHAGEMMQVGAVESKGRWSNPTYGGWQVNGDRTLKERSWNEGRFLKIPEVEPEYAVRTDFTEDILTRRLMVVTDDFIINFDYAKSEKEHEFECLYHLQGLNSINDKDTTEIKPFKNTEQLDVSPLSSGQFITDCDWYNIENGCVLDFSVEYSETKNNGGHWLSRNKTNFNDYGVMNTKLYVAYPEQTNLVVGCDPEYQDVNKQLFYSVYADNQQLAEGQFGAWVLGRDSIEVDIKSKKELVLNTKVVQVEFEENIYRPMEKTIFWGNPQILTVDGKWLDVAELNYKIDNIDEGFGIGKDYMGDKVKIQAKEFDKALPAEPIDYSKIATIKIDLSELNAIAFRSDIGGDYPVGDEQGRRRTIGICEKGTEARFITVLETSEYKHVIKNVIAESENRVVIKTIDNKMITVNVLDLDSIEGKISVQIDELKDGKLIRTEKTV